LFQAIYTDDGKQQLKPFKFTINDFDAYNMKRERWYLSTLGQAFTPDEQTLADMDRVFNKYNWPSHPTSKETFIDNPRIRPICEDCAEVSPPRRRRRVHDDNLCVQEQINDDQDNFL